MYNILIKNGIVIDGSGQLPIKADIGIEGAVIKDIGDLSDAEADTIIDANEKYVTPGFIDLHNHSDSYWTIFTIPSQESLLLQGITTIVGGNCGSSIAPLAKGSLITSIQKWTDTDKINVNWTRMKEFLDVLAERKIAVNFATLVGHGTLRRNIVGDQTKELSETEIKKMRRMLEEALEEGAWGMSTGLSYSHGRLATNEEISRLAYSVKEYDALYSTHLRDEDDHALNALDEALSVARSTGVSLNISHLKVLGKQNWHYIDNILDNISKAKKQGLNVNFDLYPYTLTNTALYLSIPDWATKGGKQALLKKLHDSETRKEIISDMKKDSYDYGNITIAITKADPIFIGKKIKDLAISGGTSVEEAVIDMVLAADDNIIVFREDLSESNIEKQISHPLSIIVSSGFGYNTDSKQSKWLIHPRSFGAFPRFLSKYVRDKKTLTWPEAIKKITHDPAKKIGFKKRGLIRSDFFADIAIFSPEKIRETATFNNPYQYPRGVSYVIVNGEIAVDNGKFSNSYTGKVLRKE